MILCCLSAVQLTGCLCSVLIQHYPPLGFLFFVCFVLNLFYAQEVHLHPLTLNLLSKLAKSFQSSYLCVFCWQGASRSCYSSSRSVRFLPLNTLTSGILVLFISDAVGMFQRSFTTIQWLHCIIVFVVNVKVNKDSDYYYMMWFVLFAIK